MQEKPRLLVTKDYSIFHMHPVNRPLREKVLLLTSMKEHGFMPSSPIHCIRNGKGLKVVRGHHRLDYAKRLKLPVWYIIDESNSDIFDLEGDTTQRWSILDFVTARALAGDQNCMSVLAFQTKHNLTLGAAINLLAGEGAGSNNAMEALKRGAFQVASDLRHAMNVVGVTDHFRSCGVSFATQSALVQAVSRALRVPEFDANVLKHRISIRPDLLSKRSSTEGYMDELEALYNFGAKGRRLPLKFRAAEVGRDLAFGERGKKARRASRAASASA